MNSKRGAANESLGKYRNKIAIYISQERKRKTSEEAKVEYLYIVLIEIDWANTYLIRYYVQGAHLDFTNFVLLLVQHSYKCSVELPTH